MTFLSQEGAVTINGMTLSPGMDHPDPLIRAVLISLFTWRRANDDDVLPTPDGSKMGWWGDSFAAVAGDRIGSRLWLLIRETLTPQTIERAREYAEEALAWMIEDNLARSVEVSARRNDLHGLTLNVHLTRPSGEALDLDIANLWEHLKNV